jgi:hypothetical protein
VKLKTRYENLQRIKSYTDPPVVSEMIQNLRKFGLSTFTVKLSLLRTTFFWVITQRVVVIPYRRFGLNAYGVYRLSRNVGKELPLLAA